MPLTNIQYDAIMRGYQQKQIARQHLIADRRREVFALSPQLAGLDGRIASCSVERARRLLDGDARALEGMSEQIAALSQKRAQILASLGYPKDYLSPPYRCPDCRDTGYIGRNRCHCFKQAAIDLVYTQSHLQEILEKENFSQFSFDYYAQDIYEPDTGVSSLEAAKNAFAKCRRFVQTFDDTFENILLFGDTGVGKTFLSHCIARELLDSAHSVIYFSASEFFALLARNTFEKDAQGKAGYRSILDCDLLIIDDLGTEMPNSFTVSQFFVCLNDRIRRQRSTLLSSNLQLGDIATIYSERIFSRISNSFTLLHLFGRDIRIQKKLAGIRS